MKRFLAVTVAVALLAAGCGIPDDTDVRVVGPGPSARFASGGDDEPSEPPARTSTSDPAALVTNYLQAAAGDPENAVNRVKAYLSDDAKVGFDAGPDIRVIRLTNDLLYTPGDPEVSFSALQVGTLKSNGVLESSPDSKPQEYTVRVSPIAGQTGLFVTKPPPALLLTDTALEKFFLRRTIYFWNSDNTGLIPDLRYMPRSVPTVRQPTTILSWLVNGPASWLGDSARGLPNGTAAPDNVPAASGDTLQVTLNAQAVPAGDGKALERLRRQLQWSLGEELIPRILELRIGNQDPVRYSGLDYQDSNVASRLADKPERFVIYNGSIRRLAQSPQPSDPVPVVKVADNEGFSSAAISASATHTYLAGVTGTGKNRKLRVGVARTGQQSDLTEVTGISGDLGRPLWAVTPDNDPNGAIGLIIAGGKLYSFGIGGKAQPVEWQGDTGSLKAISVAPDGYRVALVAGGKLYRTVLDTGGDTLTMSAPEQLLPPNFSSVAAVAWSSETYLAVAGTRADGRSAVMDVTIDGALTYPRLTDIGKETVTHLTAYPSNPISREEWSDSESYETAGGAWDVLGEPLKITAADLAGPAVTPQAGAVPTAPFFLD